jgi:hypothetical protein
VTQIPDGDWTCLVCGTGIQCSDRNLFNTLVTRHMSNHSKEDYERSQEDDSGSGMR